MRPAREPVSRRGCIFYNFGHAYTLRLLVALYSLRQVYDGPVTTFLSPDSDDRQLRKDLFRLGSEIVISDRMSKSWHRHNQFRQSPYDATLMCDSDLIFLSPIDDLWEPLERDGLLVTRFFSPPFGIEGTIGKPGFANRVGHLHDIRTIIGDELCEKAEQQILHDRIDVNIGIMGIARPTGDGFLNEWADHMERGKSRRIVLMDEMLVVALMSRHRHFLADEQWNCPADEFFRRTNLSDARVIHYFADGHKVRGIRLGRNPASWAGKQWYGMYLKAAGELDLKRWARFDPNFTGKFRRAISDIFSNGRYVDPIATKRSIRKRRRAKRHKQPAAMSRKSG